jgi:hypothetical protein
MFQIWEIDGSGVDDAYFQQASIDSAMTSVRALCDNN